jgi:hypothetical protein
VRNRFVLLSSAALLFAGTAAGALAQSPMFDTTRLSNHVKTLGSDAFEGRAPATRAERKTVDYLIAQFKAAGLQPGGAVVDGKRGWTQPVPLLKLGGSSPTHSVAQWTERRAHPRHRNRGAVTDQRGQGP